MNNFYLIAPMEVLQTSEKGDKQTQKSNIVFKEGLFEGDSIIRVQPNKFKQTLSGIGTSFTQSSAFVLAHLKTSQRKEIMQNLFSSQGANFSLARTHIGACDFCVEGKYSYADVPNDINLNHFSVVPDEEGFSSKKYPSIRNPHYDLLPMIKEAMAIKEKQTDADLRMVASAWTAPLWMKDNEAWYQPGTPENNHQGTGGSLKPEHESTYADYLIKYIEAYKQHGIDIWGLTPVNEPHGNNGQWESMHFTAQSQNDFIKHHLGPKLHQSGNESVKLMMFDHNRDELEEWADVIYNDPETSNYVSGAAIHWYESTYKVSEDILERVHNKYPGYSIIHTEGCIDDLGNDAPPGVLDPEGYKESNWFDNNSFWWNENATDWAYSATWPGVNADDHPKYTPVHRYARNIIQSLNHWVSGWIDWNCVLDQRGGPNHVGNYCGAPIMVNTASGYVYYTPIYYILAQFSKTIRPGDRVVQTDLQVDESLKDVMYSCSTINDTGLLSIQVLNTSKESIDYAIQIGDQYANVEIDANALQTIQVQL